MTTKQNETQHTPTPWKAELVETSIGSCFKIGPFPSDGVYDTTHACIYVEGAHPVDFLDERGLRLTKNAAELAANADLIVRAVNSHAALVESAQLVVDRWERGDLAEAVRALAAALAAAKGTK